jgi:hypothetical protein
LPTLSFAKNRCDGKPCSIRALGKEMNQVKRRVKIAADNHVTQRYVPPHPGLPGSREPIAIDMETTVLAPDAFLANHRVNWVYVN